VLYGHRLKLLCAVCCCRLQAIDLIDEAGSRVRISAYNARKEGAVREDPKVDEYLQVRPHTTSLHVD
jgi:hypothetical protein